MDDITRNAVTRRTFLGGALAAGGLLLAGCGGGESPSGSTTGGGAAGGTSGAAGSSGAAGGTTSAGGSGVAADALRIGVPTDFLPSAVQRFNPSNRPLRRTVFDVLIERKPDGSYAPSLAKSWEFSDDNKTLVMDLVEGVTYHSGRDFGPDDVVFAIQTAMEKKSGVQEATLLRRASGIKKSGASQVTVTFDEPFVSYLDALAMIPIVDEKTYADVADGKQIVGTGPFTWKSWTPGSTVEMGRNDSYWQEGKPYLPGLNFSIVTESQALLAAMRSGDMDLAMRMLARDAASLQKDSKFSVSASPGYDTYVGVSTNVKPLDDVRVRQAIAYCIDRKRIADQVYQGFAEPSCCLWDSNTEGITDDMINHYSYDIDKAKSLLADAGASGAEIELAPSPQDPAFSSVGDIVRYGMEQAGLKVKNVSITAADWPKRNQAHDLPGLWISLVGLTVSGAVPTLLSSNPLTPDANTSHFTTDQYTSLTNALLAASDDQKAAALGDLTSYMIDQAFHNTVVQAKVPIVNVAGLSGVTVDATLSLNLTDAKMSA
ncbi:MAG TPA: ABC transporter substrate-binding protein [Nakamurella sp.]|jgi:peptide/nickel transport system substrate-binding protein|nr:ABC transporter substrate-binding protein [Nakamurella sp.]